MSIIYIIMGALASVALFLYIIPLFRRLSEKTRERKMRSHHKSPKEFIYQKKKAIDMGNCPVCGAKLSREIRLYTRTYKAEPRDKVFIKGCSKCYTPKTGEK